MPTITIDDKTYQRWQKEANADGLTIQDWLKKATADESSNRLTPEEWVERFTDAVQSLDYTGPASADYSRQAIYGPLTL